MIRNQALIDRFLRYVQIDTQSSEKSDSVPSTQKQHDLAALLAEELRALGVPEVDYDREHCIVYAYLPASPGVALPPVGFIAHMDTSPAVSDTSVKPRFLMNYDGKDELLPKDSFPSLAGHIGEDLIATDGTTLLGADDKAGIAEIMNLAEYYTSHPEEAHRGIAIAFTPDEEVGRGADHFDPERFGANVAYTIDGGGFGEVEYETFNAAAAEVEITGRSTHPGTAKDVMRNAALIAMEFNAMLPERERPEHTEGREGFYMLSEMSGEVERAELQYIIRDHDRGIFEARKQKMNEVADAINARYGEGTAQVKLRDQYYNMAEILVDHMDLVENAERAIRALGGTPVSNPVRGGTDGSRLTFMGIPCPNLGTGGYTFHSRYEYACIREMELCAETLILLSAAD